MNTTPILITNDKTALWRIGGDQYADAYQGAALEAEVKPDGWAYTNEAKFPPDVFTIRNGGAQ